MCKLFNLSFSDGTVPDQWKLADIIPLHKKGPKNQRENYRPVSLTSVVCKVCEKIVRKNIVEFWTTKKFLIPTSLALPKGNPVSLNYFMYVMTGQTKGIKGKQRCYIHGPIKSV